MDGSEVLAPARSEDFDKCDLPPPAAFLDIAATKGAPRMTRLFLRDRFRRRVCAAGKTDSIGTIGKIGGVGAESVASNVQPAMVVPYRLPQLRSL
jgi:hypothetical protein